jgi:hypothetical protein
MTMSKNDTAMFDQLRRLVLETIPSSDAATFLDRSEIVPIERDIDGWICMSRDGSVGFLNVRTQRFEPEAEFAVSNTALIGSLARRIPLASWFVPKAQYPEVCPMCHGRGSPQGIPSELAQTVRCRCGGLGWLPELAKKA